MTILSLFLTFFSIGLFTFGGGYAMLPMISERVTASGWLTEAELIDFIAVSESTPGPFAVNIATYVGYTVAGIPGGAVATLGVVLPSFLIILLIARAYRRFRESRIVSGCMSGLKPAVLGLIAAALLSVGRTVFFPDGFAVSVLRSPVFLFSLALFALSVFLSHRKTHPILILLIAAGLGIAVGYVGKFPV